MDHIWQALIANLAVVALFAALWSQLSDWFDRQKWIARKLYIGMLAGASAIGTMLLTVEIAPGVVYDLRTCIIAVAAFFSGPVVAAVSIAMAGIFRLVQGGAGAVIGLLHLFAAALVALGVRWLARSAMPRPIWVLVLAIAITVLLLGVLNAAISLAGLEAIQNLVIPGTALTFIATLLMGLTILSARQIGRDRYILRAALSQAPEFLYVKDTNGRFLTVNEAVARHNGYTSPASLIGKSDFDLTTPDRAEELSAQERQIMETGVALLDFEEESRDASGRQHWYRTSKVPLTDKDGRVIGLAGVTIDTTALKKLEHELTESRDRLSLALSVMSDGLALFDSRGYLVFCNEQYRESFPLSAHMRVPGAHITEILTECARTGEQLDIPADDIEGWAERVGSLLRVPNVVTVEVFDGRYVQLRNSPGINDSAVVIVTDVTDLKLAERALIEANADLSRQASTDVLTGLPNRRVFDETLERDMARCGRAGSPLSLILLDIDHFKRYNDTYGHPAGDSCLAMVARALTASIQRPADLVARYGGEEFAVILPDTAMQGAIGVAERMRHAITAASTSQLGTIGTKVTASFGIAEYNLDKSPISAEQLIANADAALYAAKASGRNRVTGYGTREFIRLDYANKVENSGQSL